MKLSIIVPVYKVESYLRRCVDSILAQTFTDYELILVDDGSPDGCPAICDEYAAKDSRVVVIHKSNGGVSDARNAGLDIAQGEYIGFVDGDDFVHPQMYEIMCRLMDELSLSILQCGLTSEERWGNAPIENLRIDEVQCYSVDQFLDEYFPKYWEIFPGYVATKVYRRTVFEDIRFAKGRLFEDIGILLDTISRSERIAKIDYPLYCYVTRADSTMRKHATPKQISDHLHVYTEQSSFFRNRGNLVQSRRAQDVQISLYTMYKLQSRFVYGEKKELSKIDCLMRAQFWSVIRNPEICNLKKVAFIILWISPKVILKLYSHFYPEWVPKPLRNQDNEYGECG